MARKTRIKYGSGRPSTIQRNVAGFLSDIAFDLKQWIEQNKRVASGTALNSFEVDVSRMRGGKGPGELTAVEYIAFVLQGRGPSTKTSDVTGGPLLPPVERIAEWIREKGLDLNPWAVAKTIAALGTEGPHLSDDDIELIYEINLEKWGDRLAKDLADEVLDGMVKNFTKSGYEEK